MQSQRESQVRSGTQAEKCVEAEAAARAKLAASYERFMAPQDPEKTSEAGKELIQAVFGRDAIAEDPLG